jgi:transposase-like protein
MQNDYVFNGLSSFLKTFNEEQTCREFLEYLRWEGQPICPLCKYDKKIYKLKDAKTYKCAKCNRNFTVTVNTLFQSTHIPLRDWFVVIYLFSAHKSGISSHQIAKHLEITQRNAWLVLHRVRYAMGLKQQKEKLNGIIECDETYVGGKNKNRHWDKKFKYSQGRSVVDKTPVFGILQRNGNVIVWTLNNLNGRVMRALIKTKVEKGAIVCTDEYRVYRGLNKKKYYTHIVIDHSKGQHAVEGIYHTNNIEGFWNFIKRSIMGTYRKVSKKHLHRYAKEAAYRYNTRKLTDSDRFIELLRLFFDRKITRRQLRRENTIQG